MANEYDEAVKLARETIAATAPGSCDCDACKLARALLALAEQRTNAAGADLERMQMIRDGIRQHAFVARREADAWLKELRRQVGDASKKKKT